MFILESHRNDTIAMARVKRLQATHEGVHYWFEVDLDRVNLPPIDAVEADIQRARSLDRAEKLAALDRYLVYLTPGHKSGGLQEGLEPNPERIADQVPMKERELVDEDRS